MAQKEYGLSKAAARLMMEILQKREKPEDVPSRDTLYQQVRKRLDRIPRQHKQYKIYNGCLYVEDERTKSLKRVLVKEDEPLAIWEAHIETLEDGKKIHHCAHATYRRLKQHWMGGSRRKCDPLRFCVTCRSENQSAFLGYDTHSTPPLECSPPDIHPVSTPSPPSDLRSLQAESTPEPDSVSASESGIVAAGGTFVLLLDERILWLYNTHTRRLHARALPKILPLNPKTGIRDFQDIIDQFKKSQEGPPPCIIVQQEQSFPWSLQDMRKICPVKDVPKYDDTCQQAIDAVTSIRRELTAFTITDAVNKYNESL
eukprot:Gregarina_sp_Pseudo_9__1287@NODE_1859_length_1290_cov_66_649880_g1725_i0_p1_GENE_NODE_1859_length_1290_cov_66_649880_g1725_i0NODE_1859_length_1290_cov_66_649880_g1725_i0_p1_ORF_typecomplete_len338_score63_14MTBP_C/PF14920_6/0_37MTBP_C/PF14920_6/2_2e02_NODE_1859_length_1290_cov_66_649880_g1725_i0751016